MHALIKTLIHFPKMGIHVNIKTYIDRHISLLPDAKADPNKLINDYKIEDFQASRAWLTTFMKKI